MSSSSSNPKTSSGSEMTRNWRRRGGEIGRGFPRACRWCGDASVMRTSRTAENPGRIFHCCPNRSEKDKNHLFKWADESVIEEIEDMKKTIEEKIGNLELESRTCEAVVGSYEKKIEELGGVVVRFEKEIKELKDLVHGYEKEQKSLKNMLVCGFGIMVLYYYFVL